VRVAAAALLAIVTAAPCAAQEARELPVAIDTAAAVDHVVDQNGNTSTGVLLDSVISVQIAPHLEAVTRPFVQRLATGEWNRQIWVAELRYERSGAVGVRVDGGLIPSPVGYANLLLRPHLNPTIAQPSSLFQPLPLAEVRGPRTNLLGAVYAYGANVTISGEHWDTRAAVIDSSPMRTRRIFAETNPPRFANVVLGGGVTPFVGLRVGASVTHGGWLKAGESPSITADRDATVFNVESEFSFRYTKIAGEWTRDAIETSIGDTSASGWFIQAHQILAPRWFAAGRVERMSAPVATSELTHLRQQFTGVEEVVGYRLTPEITFRGGHRAREGFGRDTFVHAAEVSVVWAKRWM
jgi:hypothetical protein